MRAESNVSEGGEEATTGAEDEDDPERRQNADRAWFEYMPVDYPGDPDFVYEAGAAPFAIAGRPRQLNQQGIAGPLHLVHQQHRGPILDTEKNINISILI